MRHQGLAIAVWVWLIACGGERDASPPTSGGDGGAAGASAAGVSGGAGGNSGSGESRSGRSGGGRGGAGGSSGAGGGGGRDAGVDAWDAGEPRDAASDSGAVSAGPFAIEALPFPIEPGEPIDAPANQWTFVGFAGSRCANGTPTGIAINPFADAKGLLIFMQGGGACWDATTCLVSHSSVHLDDTVDENVVLSEAQQLSGLFEHDNAANPFKDYAYVYMPYCTGDLHIGTTTRSYEGPVGVEMVHHQGGLNVEAYLERLVPTFPDIERVVVSGISAGGFGATFNWWRYQAAFPRARVDVLNDAGLIVDAPDDRWATMVAAWAMALPPGCAACGQRMSAFLPFYGQHLVAPRRLALAGFLGDAVIGSYFGLTSEQVMEQLLATRANAAANQKTFFLAGTQHSVIGEGAFTVASDGTSFLPWVIELATDAPGWNHAGP